MNLSITSTAFSHNGEIPTQYTCEGADSAPPLSFDGIPKTAKTVALIMDDPDAPDPKAPKMTWVHWVLAGIPASATELPEGGKPLPAGTREGRSSWNRTGYGGPCPPIGRHRYFFKLYALDSDLADLKSFNKDQLLAAMKGHILAEAELIGTYQKKK